MKKNVLGAVVFFSMLALAGLSMYIYAARTGSGHRLREFHRTAGYLEERIAALEKQRDLLGETAAALDGQAASLQRQAEEVSRRAAQIDLEISNMRELIGGVKKSVRTPIFTLRGFRLTAGSGLIVIAFLAFIWLLYTSLRSRERDDDLSLDKGDTSTSEATAPVPGSVLEEEFPAPAAEEDSGDQSGGEDAEGDDGVARTSAAGSREQADEADSGATGGGAEEKEDDAQPGSQADEADSDDTVEEAKEKEGDGQPRPEGL